MQALLEEHRGSECLLLLASGLGDVVRELAAEDGEAAQCAADSAAHRVQQQPPVELRRIMLWFHHIIAEGKRKTVVAWARELGLGGFSKVGTR